MIDRDYRDLGFRPYTLVVDSTGEQWELISYPYDEYGETKIQIREKDKPETVRTANVKTLTLLCSKCSAKAHWLDFGECFDCVA